MNQGDLIEFVEFKSYGLLYTLNSTHVYYHLDVCLGKPKIGDGFGCVETMPSNLFLPVEVI